MHFETLKSYRRKKWFLYVLLLVVGLIMGMGFNTSMAKYQTTQSIPIVRGKISYKPYDFKIMAMYQEGENGDYIELKDRMPSTGYVINEEKSYCTKDNVNKDTEAILYTDEKGQHVISNLAYNDKCYIWFDKKLCERIACTIMANINNVSTRTKFMVLRENTTGTIYMAEDNYGDTYYFAGAVDNNWVKFGGFYWRIIRINGDGTVKMIYSGDEVSGPVTIGTDAQIEANVFNTNYNDNAYVGFMYGTPGSSTYELTHANIHNSTIKGVLDTWYNNNLKIKYGSYINSEVGFCNDRSIKNGSGIGANDTYYNPYDRLFTNKTPSFKCSHESDNFKVPVGLITADEVAYAGGYYGLINKDYYLSTDQGFWTMSPSNCQSVVTYPAFVFALDERSLLANSYVNKIYGVRPVINLRADVEFQEGSLGTSTNPYVVK